MVCNFSIPFTMFTFDEYLFYFHSKKQRHACIPQWKVQTLTNDMILANMLINGKGMASWRSHMMMIFAIHAKTIYQAVANLWLLCLVELVSFVCLFFFPVCSIYFESFVKWLTSNFCWNVWKTWVRQNIYDLSLGFFLFVCLLELNFFPFDAVTMPTISHHVQFRTMYDAKRKGANFLIAYKNYYQFIQSNIYLYLSNETNKNAMIRNGAIKLNREIVCSVLFDNNVNRNFWNWNIVAVVQLKSYSCWLKFRKIVSNLRDK